MTTAKVVPSPVMVTSKGKAKPQNIMVTKANVKFRGARAEWYAVLLKYNGKPAQDFLAETTKNPPSVPKSGIQENSTGWLRYFVRSGIATLE